MNINAKRFSDSALDAVKQNDTIALHQSLDALIRAKYNKIVHAAEITEIVNETLIVAVQKGQIEAVELLLQYSANPNWENSDQGPSTCLHYAAKQLNIESIRLLVRYGADPNTLVQRRFIYQDIISFSKFFIPRDEKVNAFDLVLASSLIRGYGYHHYVAVDRQPLAPIEGFISIDHTYHLILAIIKIFSQARKNFNFNQMDRYKEHSYFTKIVVYEHYEAASYLCEQSINTELDVRITLETLSSALLEVNQIFEQKVPKDPEGYYQFKQALEEYIERSKSDLSKKKRCLIS